MLFLCWFSRTKSPLKFLFDYFSFQTMHFGLAVSVELCVKALQLPRQEEPDTKTTVCKTVACLLPDDLEVLRGCQLTEFLLSPSREVFDSLEDLYGRPDQKYDEENAIIPNSLRCELLLALKAHWPFDPEFWDWKTLKHYCIKLLGLEPEEEESEVVEDVISVQPATNEEGEGVEKPENSETDECCSAEQEEQREGTSKLQQKSPKKEDSLWTSERAKRWQKYKFLCQICQKEVIEPRFLHHSRKHLTNGVWTCPVCLQKFESRQDLVPHSKQHLRMPSRACHLKKKKVKKKDVNLKPKLEFEVETEEDNELEPGQIPLDPSLVMYYQSTHDPVVLEHILEQAATVPKKSIDDDYITFDYIYTHYKLQNREVYPCPATDCSRIFKLFKYLGVHLKNEHDDSDPNVKHYLEMKDRREKCTFCRRTFVSGHHHRKHRRVHYGDHPFMCVVTGCGGRFDTTNQLLAHKHNHGFLLSYHCELKGCRLSFCDLGQLYHHEAQHFRDAAYTCTSPGCKKFYFCRKEFLKHLETHGITFTEKDFEAQRKAKITLLHPLAEDDSRKVSQSSKKDILIGEQNELSPSERLECKEPNGSLTCVAVCFDGKKFNCGLEKCGRTFNKAREIQKHLKTVHPDQFKEENKVCHKMETDKNTSDKSIKDHKNSPDESASGPSTQGSGQEDVLLSSADSLRCETTPSPKLTTSTSYSEPSDALTEIVLSLSQLSLNSAVVSTIRRNPRRHTSGSQVPQVSCTTSSNVRSSTKAAPNKIEVKPQQEPADSKTALGKADLKAESPPSTGEPHIDQTENNLVFQPTSKPYACDVNSCNYESVTSHALLHHYVTKHGYKAEEVKQKEIFNPLKFKPFKCNLCPKGYKERKELKAHYRRKHNEDMAIMENPNCSSKKKAEKTWPSAQLASTKPNSKDSSTSSKARAVSVEKRHVPALKDRHVNKVREMVSVGKMERRDDKLMLQEKRLRSSQPSVLKQGPTKGKMAIDGATQGRRMSKRLVTKGNKCMAVTREDEYYYCVHKGCGTAFTKRWSLLRHMQNVHRYSGSQLLCGGDDKLYKCKHSGCNKSFSHLSSMNSHYRKEHQVSEEPIRRFKCTNCSATYHLKSSLLRHTNQSHQNQSPQKPTAPSSAPPSHSRFGSFKKQIFYKHCDSVPLVVRLQSAHKRDGSNSGCQKKLIVTPSSKSLKVSHRSHLRHSGRCCSTDCDTSQVENFERIEEAPEEEPRVERAKPASKKRCGQFVYRTPEEALQMCQDRCLPVAYPCMVQNCDSVVSSMKSMQRHYVRCHKMVRTMLSENRDKLFYTAEKLEELIQKKSAVSAFPDLTRVPTGVLKMEYQAEPENPGGPSLPMSLHSIKTESVGQEADEFSGEPPPDSSVLIVADDVLYGESNGHSDEPIVQESPAQGERTKAESPTPPLVPPPLLDLSPPSTLRITVDDVSLDHLGKESKPVNVPTTVCVASATLTRQPLRRKNSDVSEPLPPAMPHSPAQKDQVTRSLSQRSFDIAGYKPLGFESSFLKFIQEKEEHFRCDRVRTVAVLNYKPEPPRRRDAHRRNGSVKENNQRVPTSHISRSKRPRSVPLKPFLSKGECGSIQNLRFILERALRDCGDQAIKQLQFLKPVVVLERPKSFASFLIPSETKA